MSTKSKTWKRIWLGLAALSLAGTIALLSGQAADAQGTTASATKKSASPTLVGTWRVTVQLYNCQTEALLGNPFASLLTFNEGGTMAGSTTNPGFAVAQRGPDQGVWNRVGQGTYSAKSAALLYFTTPPSPPLNPGFQAGTQTLTQMIRLDTGSDSFTSDATTEFFDITGQSYRQGCASAVAQRFR